MNVGSASELTQNLQELLKLAHQLENTLPGNTSVEKELAIRKIFVRSKSGQVVFETKKSKPWYKRLFQGPSYDIEKNFKTIKSLFQSSKRPQKRS